MTVEPPSAEALSPEATKVDPSVNPSVASAVECIVCREPIKPQAQICIHCKSAQNWTRHVIRWSVLVGGLLTLLPLWSGAWSLNKLAFPRHHVDIRIQPIKCAVDTVELAITNRGDRAGFVGDFNLDVEVNRKTLNHFILAPKNQEATLLKPSDTVRLSLEPQSADVAVSLPALPKHSTDICEYHISTQVNAFDNLPTTSDIFCACPTGV
jgi:hypothetical protein